MSKPDHPPSQTPTQASLPDGPTLPDSIDQKSVLMGVDATGKPSPLRLTDLAEEEPLPELKMGADMYQILR